MQNNYDSCTPSPIAPTPPESVFIPLNSCWVILHDFVVCGFFFLFIFCFEINLRVSNSLDPDQARRFVGPDRGPNCLQRISADDKIRH